MAIINKQVAVCESCGKTHEMHHDTWLQIDLLKFDIHDENDNIPCIDSTYCYTCFMYLISTLLYPKIDKKTFDNIFFMVKEEYKQSLERD